MSLIDKLKALFAAPSDDDEITCHDALRLVHEYLDGELADVPRARVEAHFEVCQRCYPHLRLESAFRDAVRRAAADATPPPELRERVLAVLAEVDREG